MTARKAILLTVAAVPLTAFAFMYVFWTEWTREQALDARRSKWI